MIICKNCETHFKGHFCNNCGQAADTHDINFHYFWHEIQHGVFHFDNGILFTIKQLFTRPGHAIRDFINGKRVQYVKPVGFVFLLCSIYALLMHYFEIKIVIAEVQMGAEDINEENKNFINRLLHSYAWLNSHYAYSMLLYLPVISLASYLAFKKTKINYLKHLVLNAFILGQVTVVKLLFIPLLIVVGNEMSEAVLKLQYLIDFIFTWWTYIQFFNNNSIPKNILLSILTYIYGAIAMLIIVVVYMELLAMI